MQAERLAMQHNVNESQSGAFTSSVLTMGA